MLKTVSKKMKVQQSNETETFNTIFEYEHEEGKAPEMVVARASMLNQKLQENQNPCRVDVSYYPKNGNLQITCHNKPEGFQVSLLDEIIDPLEEIITASVGG